LWPAANRVILAASCALSGIVMPVTPPETEIVTEWRVACDGGEGALGHPRVWLSIPQETGMVDCGYCDKRFVHKDFADAAA
jgi:uncharacterized Zn-finger protein